MSKQDAPEVGDREEGRGDHARLCFTAYHLNVLCLPLEPRNQAR
jgi:hypothetical protein